MFCYQCEQTAGGTGCVKSGVCGKDENIQSLQDILLFGLKGIAAYAYHARELGAKDDDVDAFMHQALFKTVTNVSFDLGQYIDMVLECGKINLKVMELLDKAHTDRFGNPTPVEVDTGTRIGPGIVVTGHDLLDLYELLVQTQGTGINIYTHSEMLPAHSYPQLRKFKHLAGNYGNAWQEQKKEFNDFPGAILATTNCVLTPPDNSYLGRLFTVGITGITGATHIKNRDFSLLISKAKSLPSLPEAPGKKILTGFHHSAILGIADKIVYAVKSGKIKHFFLVGGCDGAKPGRNYYTEFSEKVPKDCVILTLACGKYRFNKMDFGAIDGIPRLIDIGQCNNAYSAIQVALALAKVFNCGVNELPLSFVLSWFEQKAVAILLTLLYLDVHNIRIGPSLPAFISPGVLNVLADKFKIKPITTPYQDMRDMLSGNEHS
ncbi:MAG: hydroxylamine reductase [Candidatus Omnitrophica bacterium]|nr:hydroxylamine reductase [Candidatus Omnitrophota bacterium]MBU1928407.1 hydroxylamine reductase [Candidatus Omnitrophota bacterium]MBU2034289.1 hydroxylamine reductase [Candidatus Omnitrophota bacterium]MBU2221155.1 hydroxylamine reductase [Candidatus Omnitrophota bacterium]MBU2257521.1 hydroxylamine reductase [Candidatus Omnitrophota bacterium]